jgi:integrase
VKGTLRFRAGAWRLEASYTDDGRRRYKTRTVHAPNNRTGRRLAETELVRLVAETQTASTPTVAPDATVEQLLRRWLAVRTPDWSPTTASTNRRWVETRIIPAVGHYPLTRLTVAHVDALYASQRADGLTAASVRRTHSILRAALAQAERWGLVDRNVAALARKPALGPPRVRPPEPDEMARLTAAAERDPDLAGWLRVAAVTGARRGTLCALRWSDLDLDKGTVTFSRSLSVGDEGLVVKGTKTGRPYPVALDQGTVGVLRSHRARAAERALACGVALPSDAYVFARPVPPDGSVPWHPDGATQRFARLRREAGVEGVRLHDLRHFVATRLLAGGVDARTVAGRLGHSSAKMVLDLYGHFVPAADRVAAQRIADVVDGKG